MNLAQRPSDSECFDYHRDYVGLVPDGNILKTLKTQQETIRDFLRGIPVDCENTVHAPYSWTVRQVVEHCVDAERVFGYRILRFGCGDQTELPGWDQDDYAATDYGPAANIGELADEYWALRTANLALLTRLADAAWEQIGVADGRQVSVRTLAWLMAGHWLHHHRIVLERLGHQGSTDA